MIDSLPASKPAARCVRRAARARLLFSMLLLMLPGLAVAQPTGSATKGQATRAPSPPCVWETRQEGPIARLQPAAVAEYQGKILVFGGFFDPALNASVRVDAYDPAQDQWSRLADMPTALTHSAFATDGDTIWIIGGFIGQSPGPATNQVWKYDALNDVWSAGPNLPFARASSVAAVVGRQLHVFGGLLPDRQTDSGQHGVLDLDNEGAGWSLAAPMPQPRNHLGAAVLDGKIYAIGGQHGHDGVSQDVDDVHIYDPVSNTWTAAADLPFPRSHIEQGTTVHNDRIFIAGGRNLTAGLESLAETHAYDPTTNTWIGLPPLPEPLLSPVARILNGYLYVAYGGPLYSTPQDHVYRRRLNAPAVINRINCGGDEYRRGGLDLWCPDQLYQSGKTFENRVIPDILGTTDDELYFTERSGDATDPTKVAYRIPLEPGRYRVKLHFAEIFFGAPGGGPGGTGLRVFDIALEGNVVLANYDITASVGAITADIQTFEVDVNDGALDIQLTATVDQPKVSAIEVDIAN